jgi:acetamidase/formamidase
MAEHTLDPRRVHHKWDNSLAPVIEIDPGDVVHGEALEVTNNQITPGCDASAFASLDFSQLYPLAGPIFVKGAEPGDVLEVEVLHLETQSWGWAGILPGLGLLAADFQTPYIRHFDLTTGPTTALRDDIQIPIQPFLGTMGVALDTPGAFEVLPTGKGGGNIDTRHLTVGSKLYLPVMVQGALFSAGDGHAAQGDGEVCVTAIECPLRFSLRFDVHKGRSLRPWSYQFRTTPGPIQPASDAQGYFATTAIGPDLMANAQDAVRDMITWLGHEKGLSREDAYILCSLAGDLRISQVVDAPNWCVSFYLALSVFR